jgi:hypothetical protein
MAMRDIAKAILSAGEESAAADGDGKGNSSLLGKFDFKSLLGKKGKGNSQPAEAA